MLTTQVVCIVLLGLAIANIKAQETCPDFKPKNCNNKKEILCVLPPKNGEICPTSECIKKKFKSPTNPKKKCKAKCPIDCGDQLSCPGPVDKNVIIFKD